MADYRRREIDDVIADAGYDTDAIRQWIRSLRARACIKPNPSRNKKLRYKKQRYKHRNVIERFFGRIKTCRRVATRYEKLAVSYLAVVHVAMIRLYLKRVTAALSDRT